MPYVTRKKIERVRERPLLLKVDLDDDKLPSHYDLDSGTKPLICGTVSILVDENYYVKCVINKDYKFQVFSSGYYVDSGSKCVHERCLMLPKELVRDYAIDAGMGIELLLREIVTGEEVEKIFSERMEQGSMDFEPKGLSGEALVSSELLIATNFTDNYYADLVSEINNAFRIRLFTSTMVLVRKLFENLLVDLLRQRYGTKQVEIYYSTRYHMHHSLSTLIRNLKDNFDSFQIYNDVFYRDKDDFLKFLGEIKEEGDRSAHVLELQKNPDKINAWKPSINKYSDLIVRVIQKIKETPSLS